MPFLEMLEQMIGVGVMLAIVRGEVLIDPTSGQGAGISRFSFSR